MVRCWCIVVVVVYSCALSLFVVCCYCLLRACFVSGVVCWLFGLVVCYCVLFVAYRLVCVVCLRDVLCGVCCCCPLSFVVVCCLVLLLCVVLVDVFTLVYRSVLLLVASLGLFMFVVV